MAGGQPDLDRLKSVLLNSGLQIQNNALYQVINQLIDWARQIQIALNANISSVGGAVNDLSDQNFLTWADESVDLPSSRQLLAGTGVTFDDTIAFQRTINAGASAFYDAPLTDGNVDETDLIFANGECIIVQVPNP